MAGAVPQVLFLALKIYIGIQTRLFRCVILRLVARRRSPVVWAYTRDLIHWWDTIVPDFSPHQFVQNFRVSRESFDYICGRVGHVMRKRNTNYRLCVPVRKSDGNCHLKAGHRQRVQDHQPSFWGRPEHCG
ncbi:hypothetical protein L3Q82_017305 [Scortum barcoo]|uniref:Uncharacterized protein n=1 Tax=Scortum barcoo TaxID=214431 RepID=A0ACB8VK29_9TELE|nr:hypothetical protein L3Q82_017305 [Scortum barcoo]